MHGKFFSKNRLPSITKMSDKFTSYARSRATAAAGTFSAVGLLAPISIIDWNRSWPLILFYVTLVLNTYFSVRCFSSISPKWELRQELIDAILAVLYIMLALNFNIVRNFIVIATLLFVITVLKYILLAETVGYSKLIHRKIRLNTLGTLYCFLALIGILWGYGRQVSIIWAVGFVLANIYVLWWEPHYDPKHHYENSK